MFSPLIDTKNLPEDPNELKAGLSVNSLSQLPQFIQGKLHLNVPVYTVYGASEDLGVVERFRSGAYKVANLHLIDENHTSVINTASGHTIRLIGLGGNLILHRLFDNGDGVSTCAGTYGIMWTTVLQIGQLIQTVRKTFDPSEIRILVTHPSPSRDGLLTALALALRADFTISSGLHFMYGSSFNEYSVNPSFEAYRHKLVVARAQFMEIWGTVKNQILTLIENEPIQKTLFNTALEIFEKMPESDNPAASHEKNSTTNEYIYAAHRNMWHFNLCDAAYGTLVLNVVDGKVSAESKGQGFNFQYRKNKQQYASSIKSSTYAAVTSNGVTQSNAVASTTVQTTAVSSSSKSKITPSGLIPAAPVGQRSSSAPNPSGPKKPENHVRGSASAAIASKDSTRSTTPKPVKRVNSKPEQLQSTSSVAPAATVLTSQELDASNAGDSQESQPPSEHANEQPIITDSSISDTVVETPEQTTESTSEPTLEPPSDPGVWVANGQGTEQDVKELFNAEDQPLITSVSIKESFTDKKKFALVYFSSLEQATTALDRVDRERAGRVSLISSFRPHRNVRSWNGTRGRGGFRGRGGIRGGRLSSRGDRQ